MVVPLPGLEAAGIVWLTVYGLQRRICRASTACSLGSEKNVPKTRSCDAMLGKRKEDGGAGELLGASIHVWR